MRGYRQLDDEYEARRRNILKNWKLSWDLRNANKKAPYRTSLTRNGNAPGSQTPTGEKKRTTLAESLAGFNDMADFKETSYTLVQEYDYGNGKTATVTLDKVLDNKKIADFMKKNAGGTAELYFRSLDSKALPMTINKTGKVPQEGSLDDFAKSKFGKEITKAILGHIQMTIEKYKELEAKQQASERPEPKPAPERQSQAPRNRQPPPTDQPPLRRQAPSAFSQPDQQQLKLNSLQEQKLYCKELLRLSSEEYKLLSSNEPPPGSPTVPGSPLDTPRDAQEQAQAQAQAQEQEQEHEPPR